MSEDSSQNNASVLFEIIQHTVELQRCGREVLPNSDQEKQLVAEIEELSKQRERGPEVLKALFPETIPISVAFYERLTALAMRLGWGDISHRVTGLLLVFAAEQLPAASCETLLTELMNVKDAYLFQILDAVPMLMAEVNLLPEFAARWFPALHRRIGSNLATDGFWLALGAYCERHTQSALEVLRSLLNTQSEDEISVASYILGAVRSLDLDATTEANLASLEAAVSSSVNIGTRAIWHRSWIQTAWRGKLQRTNFEWIISRMSNGLPEEREQIYGIVSRILLSPSISADCFKKGLEWLGTNTSDKISPMAKYNVVDFAARLPPALRKEAGELVLSIQPLEANHKGIWQRVEGFFVKWLELYFLSFREFFMELARKNARNLLEVLMAPQSFDWFLSELRGKDAGDLVGHLIFSQLQDSRRIGLFLFEKLEIIAFSPALLDAVDEIGTRVAFYEFQRSQMHGKATARYLIMLASCLQRCSPDFHVEFYDEVVLQLKNYAGSCHDEIKLRISEFSIFKKAIEEVDLYFEALCRVRQSQQNTMEVPGCGHATLLHSRHFSNAVAKGTEERSGFMQFVKKVHLLYGRKWSSFQDGKLGQPSELKKFSTSVEIPRLEEINPEGMALRRYFACTRIVELTNSCRAASGDENK